MITSLVLKVAGGFIDALTGGLAEDAGLNSPARAREYSGLFRTAGEMIDEVRQSYRTWLNYGAEAGDAEERLRATLATISRLAPANALVRDAIRRSSLPEAVRDWLRDDLDELDGKLRAAVAEIQAALDLLARPWPKIDPSTLPPAGPDAPGYVPLESLLADLEGL